MFDYALRTFVKDNRVTYSVNSDLRYLELEFPEFFVDVPVFEQISLIFEQIPHYRSFNRIYNLLRYSGYTAIKELTGFSRMDLPVFCDRISVIVSVDPLIEDRFNSGLYEKLFPHTKTYLANSIENARRMISKGYK